MKAVGLTGYDIELGYRFAAWLGAGVRFEIYDFGSIVQALEAGKIDVIMSNLQYLPEHEESQSMIPSDVLYEEKMGIMVKKEKEDNMRQPYLLQDHTAAGTAPC